MSGNASPPYPRVWNLVPLLGGLLDPLLGILGKVVSIFWYGRIPVRADSPCRRRRGLTVILGGIEGPSLYNHAMTIGVLRSGYRGAVVRMDWNAGLWGLRSLINLTSRRHHQCWADRLAAIIANHLAQHPNSPVCLLAQSGGCWIAVRALELLPENVLVRAAVLLAPSISPVYDIRLAASRCETSMTSIGAAGDFFFLGLGTMVFGTSDRVFTPAAGYVGWHHHPPGFVEARWHPRWMRDGYLGNHVTSSHPRFIREVVAPLMNRDHDHNLTAP